MILFLFDKYTHPSPCHVTSLVESPPLSHLAVLFGLSGQYSLIVPLLHSTLNCFKLLCSLNHNRLIIWFER